MISNWRKKLISAIIVLYSLLVIASATPTFGNSIPNDPIVIYFMFLPGFAMTLLMRESYSLFERICFSLILSIAAVLSLLAIRDMIYPADFPLPYDVVIPVFTLILTAYYYFNRVLGVKMFS